MAVLHSHDKKMEEIFFIDKDERERSDRREKESRDLDRRKEWSKNEVSE